MVSSDGPVYGAGVVSAAGCMGGCGTSLNPKNRRFVRSKVLSDLNVLSTAI